MGRCNHCQLEFNEDALYPCEINGKVYYFCCHGCEGIFKLLQQEGLGSFYERLGYNELQSQKDIPKDKNDVSSFDSDSFINRYVKQKKDYYEIALILQGIHCIACIWLNEKILQKQEGIIECSINYTTNKATILFNPNQIKLSQIITLIRSIGYDAFVYDSKLQEIAISKTRKDYYIRLAVGIFCTMNIMWIAVAQYAGYFSGISDHMRMILNVAGFLLCTPTLFYSGWHFWRGAFFSLKHKMVTMDLLLVSGTTLAYIYSIYASFVGLETYFESITMIITFVLAGKFLEARGKKMASDALDNLNANIPTQVRVIDNKTQQRTFISPDLVQIGDRIETLVGERVVVDGELESSFGLLDESALSGESLPIQKKAKESIYSGSLVLQSPIVYVATKTFENSILSHIIALVEDSLKHRPIIQTRANEISRYFSLSVLMIALCTFLVWTFVFKIGAESALVIAISVIVIACPCALALATPIASVVGLGEAFLHKILFKEARFLETMAKANVLVLDKTGTITQGKLQVTFMQLCKNEITQRDLNILYGLVAQNNHLISNAVKNYLLEHFGALENLSFSQLEQIEARGLFARIDNCEYLGGSLALMEEYGVQIPSELEINKNGSIFCFAKKTLDNSEIIAIFYLEDKLKPQAKDYMDKLKQLGLEIVILSGDREEVTQQIAKELGIKRAISSATPTQKAEFITTLHKNGKVVVMAGDGLNDTIALAQSEVGIAMGNGVDVAVSVSDVVILDDSLLGLYQSFLIAKATFSGIKQNLAISLIYNICSIPLAVCGFVIPLIAAISMSFSSLLVVGNSLRIRQRIRRADKLIEITKNK